MMENIFIKTFCILIKTFLHLCHVQINLIYRMYLGDLINSARKVFQFTSVHSLCKFGSSGSFPGIIEGNEFKLLVKMSFANDSIFTFIQLASLQFILASRVRVKLSISFLWT